MQKRIEILGPKDPRNKLALNVTSLSKDWPKAFSPMVLGPVTLASGLTSRKMENAWQFSKIYPEHWDETARQPNTKWQAWSAAGFASWRSDRYPLGREVSALGFWWQGRLLNRVEARRHIYAPLYAQAVLATKEWPQLLSWYQNNPDPILWDVDGYKRGEKNSPRYGLRPRAHYGPRRGLGHAFALSSEVASPSAVLGQTARRSAYLPSRSGRTRPRS